MSAGEFLLRGWDPDASVIFGCVAVVAAYFFVARARGVRATLFCIGVVSILLALISPLDALADDYLFSAHMAQHLILILVAPPLMVAGMNDRVAALISGNSFLRSVEARVARASVAWTIGIVSMTAWHIPALYNLALASESIHIVEHLTFLVGAVIFWWPIFAPTGARLGGGAAALYIGAGAIAGSVLGIAITFSSPALYPAYLNPRDDFHILPLIRDQIGLSPALDVQLGGLLMWVGSGLVFLGVMIFALARWYREGERLPQINRARLVVKTR